jgi:hypothetical protein
LPSFAAGRDAVGLAEQGEIGEQGQVHRRFEFRVLSFDWKLRRAGRKAFLGGISDFLGLANFL